MVLSLQLILYFHCNIHSSFDSFKIPSGSSDVIAGYNNLCKRGDTFRGIKLRLFLIRYIQIYRTKNAGPDGHTEDLAHLLILENICLGRNSF